MLAFAVFSLAAAASPVAEAERLATHALAGASPPAAALAEARRALALTADFDPTDFVKAGRKGEVVEDEFVAARRSYRRHRALLYEAVGMAQARAANHPAAARYLRRATLLEPTPERVVGLARALLSVGRAAEALPLVLGQARGAALDPPTRALIEEAVDAAGLPSAQVEIDRVRLQAAAPTAAFRDGPLRLASAGRLSTGAPLSLEEATVVFYAADASCRSCSVDLQALKRATPAGVRVVLVPASADDQALRRILDSYGYGWPILIGGGAARELALVPGSVLVVARGGWAAAAVDPPFLPALSSVLTVFAGFDVRETVPRKAWNLRPINRKAAASPPALLPEGLAPGEDEPVPDDFTAAVAAYRARRPGEALRLFEGLEAKGDGWLLPPEARLDRALSLAALGRREEARRLLLKTGDSRFQEEVDRALEKVGSGR